MSTCNTRGCNDIAAASTLSQYHMKKCAKCSEVFSTRLRERNKSWHKENPGYNKQWREDHPEIVIANNKSWREDNPLYAKSWREDNAEEISVYVKSWRTDNLEMATATATAKRWRENNPEKSLLLTSNGEKQIREMQRLQQQVLSTSQGFSSCFSHPTRDIQRSFPDDEWQVLHLRIRYIRKFPQ